MRVISLQYPATCKDCGASLPAGSPARYYGRGKVYGTECHADPGAAVKAERRSAARSTRAGRSSGKMVWIGGERVRGSRCEDAPCCGCCGPGSDDPAYQPQDAPEPYEGY